MLGRYLLNLRLFFCSLVIFTCQFLTSFFLQVWAYVLLGLNRRQIRHQHDQWTVPVMSLWTKDEWLARAGGRHHSLDELRRLIDDSLATVTFYPWARVGVDFPDTWMRTRSRVCLTAPVADCLYLGERVSRQWGEQPEVAFVPEDPPPMMLTENARSWGMMMPARNFLVGTDYGAFIAQRLALPREPLGEPQWRPSFTASVSYRDEHGDKITEVLGRREIPPEHAAPPHVRTVSLVSLSFVYFSFAVLLGHCLMLLLCLQVPIEDHNIMHQTYLDLRERYKRLRARVARWRCRNVDVAGSASGSSGDRGGPSSSRRSRRRRT